MINKKTPTTNPTTIPTTQDINGLWRAHRRFARSYKENKRKQAMFKLCKKAAWGLFIGDIVFSYMGVEAFSGDSLFALFLAVFIGVLQWCVSESILSKALSTLVQPDTNNDGSISIAEWGRLGIYWMGVLVAYGLDIATNMSAIDAGVLGTLPLTIAMENPIAPVWVAWTVSLAICTILCFSDEMIHSIADSRLGDLEEEVPALRERAAIVEARLKAAGAFAAAYVDRAEAAGRQRGESQPI